MVYLPHLKVIVRMFAYLSHIRDIKHFNIESLNVLANAIRSSMVNVNVYKYHNRAFRVREINLSDLVTLKMEV